MKWYLQAFKNAFDFKGRASRSEYWYFFLFNVLIFITLFITGIVAINHNINIVLKTIFPLLVIYSLIIIIPSISVNIRRLHDTNHSGFWLLLHFIPYAGSVFLLVFMTEDSEPSTNKWGRNPKNPAIEDITEHLIDDFD